MNEYRDKLASISAPRRAGTTRTEVYDGEGGKVRIRTTDHWDGRRDVAVVPQPARVSAVLHGTGKRKGEVATFVRDDA